MFGDAINGVQNDIRDVRRILEKYAPPAVMGHARTGIGLASIMGTLTGGATIGYTGVLVLSPIMPANALGALALIIGGTAGVAAGATAGFAGSIALAVAGKAALKAAWNSWRIPAGFIKGCKTAYDHAYKTNAGFKVFADILTPKIIKKRQWGQILLEAAKENVPPLSQAKRFDRCEQALKNGANVDMQDKNGTTPLMYAAYHDDIRLIRLLIEHGAQTNLVDVDGCKALDLAKGNETKYVIKSKITDITPDSKGYALLDIQENGYRTNTAAHYSAKELIDKGINTEVRNIGGRTPLMLAIMAEDPPDIINALIEAGANISEGMMRAAERRDNGSIITTLKNAREKRIAKNFRDAAKAGTTTARRIRRRKPKTDNTIS